MFEMTLVAVGLLAAAPADQAAGSDVVPKIIEHLDQLYRSKSIEGTLEIHIVTEDFQRDMTADLKSAGNDKAIITITSPPKEAGTVTLRNGHNIWQYYPRVDRTVKIAESLLGGAWLGSHFSFEDMVRSSSLTRDFDGKLSGESKGNGEDLLEVTLTRRPNAGAVWNKIELAVRKSDYTPVEERFFDDKGKLTRSMSYSDVRQVGWRVMPTKLTVKPADKPNESTTVVYKKVEFDAPVSDDSFSLRALKR
jgi:outer membrane lipoprotein-sorting protein